MLNIDQAKSLVFLCGSSAIIYWLLFITGSMHPIERQSRLSDQQALTEFFVKNNDSLYFR
jgi:hypothetical protein